MPPLVRPATLADLPAIVALDARAYGGSGYGPYVVRQLFDLSPATFLVALAPDGAPIAYCAAALASDGAAWLLSLATDPAARRLGAARALAEAALAALAPLAPSQVRLTVAPPYAPPRALYASLAFIERALVPDYYGPGQDRLLLARAAPCPARGAGPLEPALPNAKGAGPLEPALPRREKGQALASPPLERKRGRPSRARPPRCVRPQRPRSLTSPSRASRCGGSGRGTPRCRSPRTPGARGRSPRPRGARPRRPRRRGP